MPDSDYLAHRSTPDLHGTAVAAVAAGIISTIWLTGTGALIGFGAGGGVWALVVAGIGLVFGAVFGWAIASASAYEASPSGILAYLVDHTWSLPNTAAGAIYLGFNLLLGNRIDRAYTLHSARVHLRRGILPGYLTTVGTVVAGIAPAVHAHEYGHVLQARIFGPTYLPLVIANYVIATVLPYWLLFHDRARYPINSFGAYFMRGVYPHTWHEEWCYRVYGPAR